MINFYWSGELLDHKQRILHFSYLILIDSENNKL